MGWKGIIIDVKSDSAEESYLLKIKGLLNGSYALIDSNDREILTVKSDFNWNKFKYEYLIETPDEFDRLKMKEAILLTIIHGINYQSAMMAGTA